MNEHKCVVSQCCCGCTLRTGSLAIGIVTLVLAILNAIYGVYQGVNHVNSGWVSLVINILTIILCILLIMGINQERRSFVMAWVWGMTVMVVINIILAIVIIVTTLDISYTISMLISMAIIIYLIIVVRSHGLKLSPSPEMA